MTLPLIPPRMGIGAPPPPQLAPAAALPGPPLVAPPVAPLPVQPLAPAVAGVPGAAVPSAAAPAAPAQVPPAPAPLAPPVAPPPAGPPPPPQPHPPTVGPDSKIVDRPQAKDITNPFERQATMIVDQAQDYAKRMAANLGEHPSDTVETDSATTHEMFNFSPYGTAAPQHFWQIHEELLQTAMRANDPDPYAVAERGALDEVYPYRAKLGLLDSLGPEQRVTRAEQLLKISHGEIAKGNPPDALPSIVGPSGLPPPDTSTTTTTGGQ